MQRLTENKIVLVFRETRLEELKARFNTVGQARFYVQSVGGDFLDYEREDAAYQAAVGEARDVLGRIGRVQLVHRRFLPNFLFGHNDLVVAIGQDGLVANTLKYLDRLPLIGVNPDPSRYDGKLLPFQVRDLAKVVPEVFRLKRPLRSVTMARATLNNGQTLHGVNDLFIGPKSHGSARYTLRLDDQCERHSSSGVIVSTGLGSTGWLTSLITGATAVAAAFRDLDRAIPAGAPPLPEPQVPWDDAQLFFTVREPFPSKTTGASLVFGRITPGLPLAIESHMAERGVIFSDGIEADFMDFNAGTRAVIDIAERRGLLVE